MPTLYGMKTPLALFGFLAWSVPVWAGIGEGPPPAPSVSNYLVGVPPHLTVIGLLSLSLAASSLGLGLARQSSAENAPPPLPWTLPLGAFLLAVGVVVLWSNRERIGYSFWTYGFEIAEGPSLQTSPYGARRKAPGPPFAWLLLRGWLELAAVLVPFLAGLLLTRRLTIGQRCGVGLWLSLCNYPLLVLAAAMAEAGKSPIDFVSLQPLWFGLAAAMLVSWLDCNLLRLAFNPQDSIFDASRQLDNLVVILVNFVTVLGLFCCCMPLGVM
jgi:hypothetical protein